MLPTFPYMAMTITGVLHVLLGFTIFINITVGLNMKVRFLTYYELHLHKDISEALQQALQQRIQTFLGIVVGCSLWMIMVGILGLLTGVKRMGHQRTHNFKIAYMVTAILSAVIFSLTGLSLSVAVKTIMPIIGLVGGICSFADFVLSIVSSSICCCCADPTSNLTGVVFVQSSGPVNYPPGNNNRRNYLPADYPHPYPASVRIYPAPQAGVANLSYQLSGLPNNYTTNNEVS